MVDSLGQSFAGIPLPATKCYVPGWRPSLVARPRLIARLVRGTGRTLTLVSAPESSGKTTILAEGLAAFPAGERPAAWVSLDPSDNDPALFWAHVITALHGMLRSVRDLGLPLISVNRVEPDHPAAPTFEPG